MILRATTTALGLAAAAVMLSGCLAPAPEPTPTSTAVFASEDDAFAAAEETYRAYVDAANQRREDATSDPDPQSFLVGDALQTDIDSRREFDDLGVRIVGPSEISAIALQSADLNTGDVAIRACYDSTAARVVNEVGDDVTKPDRDPTVLVQVSLTPVGSQLLIANISAVEGGSC